ncbi:LacI family DNA-binding transcriptional regulator [Shouchella clausii]|uniref:LacI family DNA-binding transcriptional regulator n=1 Tax=Shouchella clausii TaxID=79880 RepID=UPI0026FA90F1|nr:LacI family DNA-binding transcriptional regulator [Shouchella clausii]MDO7269299.1 LacI family DNA-binding transcriptional regulator [Shouchella clausii]MDO7289181.1 LacI family DNA-binding transcriptional regulator [Shouchella clausii]
MPTIKDIAKLAGVSITTVSRVLNNHPYVSEEKRIKVKTIIEELNYQQNFNAIRLVKGETLTLGVIIPYINHPYFQSMVGGVMEKAFENNYAVLCCATNYNKKIELNYLLMLKRKQLDGLIICSHANDWETILSFTEYGPIIGCEFVEEAPCVYIDHYDAFKSVLKYLIDKGHRNIGYCTGRKNSLSSKMRFSAFEDSLSKVNQKVSNSWVFTDCFTLNDGKKVIDKLYNEENMPTAILANGDEVAAGIIIQAKAHGIKIPEELSIIGLDNAPISEALGLTTLDLNIKSIGEQAFQLFFDGVNKKIKQPFHLVKRTTVSFPKEK